MLYGHKGEGNWHKKELRMRFCIPINDPKIKLCWAQVVGTPVPRSSRRRQQFTTPIGHSLGTIFRCLIMIYKDRRMKTNALSQNQPVGQNKSLYLTKSE